MSFFRHYIDSFTYLFRDPAWANKLWPLPLVLFIPFINILGLIFIKGWQIHAIRSMAGNRGVPALEFPAMMKSGLRITGATVLYLSVPAVVCLLLGIGGLTGFIMDIYTVFTRSLEDVAKDQMQDWLMSLFVYSVWAVISVPVLQSGIIRYTLTGKWSALLNVPANVLFLIRNAHHFLKFYVFYLLTVFILVVADILLGISIIGALLIPFTVVMYYGSVSYELAHLARKVAERRNVSLSGQPTPPLFQNVSLPAQTAPPPFPGAPS